MVNTLRQIVKITGTTGTGLITDFTISPSLLNVDKAFCVVQFRPLSAQAHDDTWKANEILNTTTLRIHGGTTVDAVPFVAYIIEFDAASDLVSQVATLGQMSGQAVPQNNSTSPGTSTLSPAVNLAETMELDAGHGHEGGDTTIGQEELAAIKLLTTTTWEYDLVVAPNSLQATHRETIVDWNDSGVVVQRGEATMGTTATSLTLTAGGTDFNTVVTGRSMIFCTSKNLETSFSPPTDEVCLNMEFNGNDIDITRQAQGGFGITIQWVIVEFPVGFATVQHLVHTMTSGQTSVADTITALDDFNNAFIMGTTQNGYFAYSGSRPSAAATAAGIVDQIMVSYDLTSNTNVNVVRDASGTAIRMTYQVIEFLAAVTARKLFQSIYPNTGTII